MKSKPFELAMYMFFVMYFSFRAMGESMPTSAYAGAAALLGIFAINSFVSVIWEAGDWK